MKATPHRLRVFVEGRTVSIIALTGLILLLFSLTGCIGFMPGPTQYQNHGRPVCAAEVRFVKAGFTTRADIMERLGTNYVSLPMETAIAYPWENKGLTFEWYFVAYGPYGGGSIPLNHESMPGPGGWQAWFVAFDDAAVVRATAFKRLHSHKSMHEHLDTWVKALPEKSSRCQR